MKLKQLSFCLVLVCIFGWAAAAGAAQVVSMTIEDVGSGLPGAYSSTLDGFSGGFRFSKINDTTYLGTSLWYGDVAADPGPAMGEIDTSVANPINTFTTGFLFAGAPFRPESLGPIVADISLVNGLPEFTITELPFAGEFGDPPGSGTLFVLGPQPSAPIDCEGNTQPWQPLSVHWINQIDANHFSYKVGWSHCITAEESASFGGLEAYWRLEGIATTVIPVPAAGWLIGSGLVGLFSLARRKRTV